MPDFCRSCKAEVHWTITPTGANAPINLAPDREKGNTLLLRSVAFRGSLLSVVLSGDALKVAREVVAPLYLNHWATCPDREEWRERTGAKKGADG